jgi:hypothetical protein
VKKKKVRKSPSGPAQSIKLSGILARFPSGNGGVYKNNLISHCRIAKTKSLGVLFSWGAL